MCSRNLLLVAGTMLAALALAAFTPCLSAQALPSGNLIASDDLLFEVIGQVKNSPPAGPGLPPTSVQYGYLSHINGLDDGQIYASGLPQNETSAFFTFFNESNTLRVTPHGSLTIVIREGTTTVFFNPNPSGDLTTPNPDSFRQGTPILTTTWRHQVILNPATGLFFVTFWHTVTSVTPLTLNDQDVRLAKVGDRIRLHLVGGPDPAGKVNGKFAGYFVAQGKSRD